MKDLFGNESTPPREFYTLEQQNKWTNAFYEWANDEYFKKSDMAGRFCCGYDWCCEKCKQEKMEACLDCVDTIVEILLHNNIIIDYEDYDFKKWEEMAKNIKD